MLKKILWYDIAIRFRDFIKNYHKEDGTRPFEYLVDRDNLVVKVGSGNTGEYPAIWILFGSEEDLEKQGNITASIIQFWIDTYVLGGSTDESDFDDSCYRQLYDMGQELLNMIYEFQKLLIRDYGLGVNIEIPAVYSDGDENAPATAMQRIIMNLEVYSNR